MKKVLALVLTVIMGASMITGCTKPAPVEPVDPVEAVDPVEGGAIPTNPGKIAIITGTVSQGEEEFQTAKLMKEMYPDHIVTATYPDNFAKETETTISNVLNLVSDPDVKVLVFAQGVPGAAAAILKAKEVNPTLLAIIGVPGEDPNVIAAAADIVLIADEVEGMGEVLPQQAFDMGAKTFVHISFPRHMSYATLSARRDLLKANSKKLGMEFVEFTAPDPTGDAGTPGAQQAILENVPKLIAKYGEDTAFFSTNCSMQEPLIKSVAAGHAIYPQPCCPSPVHGFPGAFGVKIPADKAGDMDYAITAITAKVKEAGMTGRMATWPVPINQAMIKASVAYGFKWIDGTITNMVDQKAMTEELTTAAGGKTVNVTVFKEGGTEYPNMFALLCEYLTF